MSHRQWTLQASANYPQTLLCWLCLFSASWYDKPLRQEHHFNMEALQTFGFATEEFKVTPDRLGVYLPVVCSSDFHHTVSIWLTSMCQEHIDNPSKYLHYCP